MKGIAFSLMLAGVLMSSGLLWAQNDVDALRYSMLRWNGTARFAALSGAFSALGADFSTLSTNPAGLGLYRANEISMSLALTNTATQASFLERTDNQSALTFNVPGLGAVFSLDLTKKNRENDWKRFNFGFGFNRIADFNQYYRYSGFNTSSSWIDYYVAEANQNGGVAPGQITDTYPFGAGMFYQGYLINPLPSDTNQYSGVVQGGQIWQYGDIRQQRNLSDLVLAAGANYNDKLLLGFTLSMASISYRSNQVFEEKDLDNLHPDFEWFYLRNSLQTIGAGLAAKLGLTYLVNDHLRLALAAHTPTHFWMQDVYDSYLSSSTELTGSHEWLSPLGRYDYELTTPWRLISGAAFVLPTYGLLSLDYELVDYRSMRYRFRTMGTLEERNLEQEINQKISEKYIAAHQVRMGAEAVLNEFRLRGGISYSTSPFNADVRPDEDLSRLSWSAGAGYRGNRLYIDGAVVWMRQKQFFQPYTLAGVEVPGVSLRKTTTDYLLTVGFRF